jgi:hypothetical protein
MLKKIVFELLLQFQHFWVWYRPGEMFPNEKVRQILKRLWEWSRTQHSVHWTGLRRCPFCNALLEEQSVYCVTCGADTPRQ